MPATLTKVYDPYISMGVEDSPVPADRVPAEFAAEQVEADRQWAHDSNEALDTATVTRDGDTWALTLTFTDGLAPQVDRYTLTEA